jgi:transposase-like protein
MTAYRWVSSFGYDLLPVAALFGLVRSSGVIGVDEKYVKVGQPAQPTADYNGWMYVYLAVDCYSYDLLHIEIYPANTRLSASAFLLAVRAKGYRPRVVVTDLRVDYHDLITQVFPQAIHHECIFHALQEVHRRLRQVYGSDYTQTRPEVVELRQSIDQIFQAHTKRTAQRRYEQVLAQRDAFVAQTPDIEATFAFLERHWPRLVNAIDSHLIPTTNNATEQVTRSGPLHSALQDLLWLPEDYLGPAVSGGLREGLPLHPLLQRCSPSHSGQVSFGVSRLQGEQVTYDPTLSRLGPPVVGSSLSGACPQCVTIPQRSL